MRRSLLAVVLCCACTSLSPSADGSDVSPEPSVEPDEPSELAAPPVVAETTPPTTAEPRATAEPRSGLASKILPEPPPPPPRHWAAQVGGKGIDSLTDAAFSPNGAVALLGRFGEESLVEDPTGARITLRTRTTGLTDGNYLVVLDDTGRTRFAHTLNESGTMAARQVAFAPNGDIVVAGWFDGTAEFQGRRLRARSTKLPHHSRGDEDGFLARFSPKGELTRVDTFGGPEGLDISGLELTADGDIVLAGHYTGPLELGGLTLDAPEGDYNTMIFAARLDREANARWLVPMGGKHQDFSEGVAVTRDGEVLVTGFCRTRKFEAGPHTLDCGKGISGYVAKLSTTGEVLWARVLLHEKRRRSKAHFAATTTGVTSLSDGGVLLTAIYADTLKVSPTITLHAKGEYLDAAVVRYDADGNVQWARSIGAEGQDRLTAPISDGRGGAWLAGTLAGPPMDAFEASIDGVGLEADDPALDPEPIRWPDSAAFVHVDAAGTWGPLVRLGGEPFSTRGLPIGRNPHLAQIAEGRHVFLDAQGRLRIVGMFLGPLPIPGQAKTLQSNGVERVANEDDVFIVATDIPGPTK